MGQPQGGKMPTPTIPPWVQGLHSGFGPPPQGATKPRRMEYFCEYCKKAFNRRPEKSCPGCGATSYKARYA